MKYIYIATETDLTLNTSGILVAKLFEKLDLPYRLVTTGYQPNLSAKLTELGVPVSKTINLFDYFQGLVNLQPLNLNFSDLAVTAEPIHLPNLNWVELLSQQFKSGKLVAYPEATSRPAKIVFEDGATTTQLNYDVRGLLSSIDQSDERQVLQRRDFLSMLGEVVLTQTDKGYQFPNEQVDINLPQLVARFNQLEDVSQDLQLYMDYAAIPDEVQDEQEQQLTLTQAATTSVYNRSHLQLQPTHLFWLDKVESNSMRQKASYLLVVLAGDETPELLETLVNSFEALMALGPIVVELVVTSENLQVTRRCQMLLEAKEMTLEKLALLNEATVAAHFKRARMLIQCGNTISPRVLQGVLSVGLPTLLLANSESVSDLTRTFVTRVYRADGADYAQELQRLLMDLNYWNLAHQKVSVDSKGFNQTMAEVWLAQILRINVRVSK